MGQWPDRPWELTAPESFVLRHGARCHAATTYKLAVKEVVARHGLRVRARPGRWRGKALVPAPNFDALHEDALFAPVLTVFPEVRLRPVDQGTAGAPVGKFARTARARYSRRGETFARYRDEHVLPALEQKGLVEPDPHRQRWERTREGRAAEEELVDWVAIGRRRLREWARGDRERARLYADGARSALLLLENDVLAELTALRDHGPTATDPARLPGGLDTACLDDLDVPDFGDLEVDTIFNDIE